MEFLVDVTELFIGYMSVDLSGGNVGMTQEFLYQAQINALSEQISGIGVAQGVGTAKNGQAGNFNIFFNNILDASDA